MRRTEIGKRKEKERHLVRRTSDNCGSVLKKLCLKKRGREDQRDRSRESWSDLVIVSPRARAEEETREYHPGQQARPFASLRDLVLQKDLCLSPSKPFKKGDSRFYPGVYLV